MSKIEILPVIPASPEIEEVWRLYRENSATLGFLPRGAFDQFAASGGILMAKRTNQPLGYVAWRRSRNEAVLVHLCVGKAHRGSNYSSLLLDEMINYCSDEVAIRIRCRKDYRVNSLWPQYDFAFEGEIRGRGADASPLLVWRRRNREPPQLDIFSKSGPSPTNIVALDANVFYDILNPNSQHHDESSSLLADWLDDVDVRVTRELRNEIARQHVDSLRQRAFNFFQDFPELATYPDQMDEALKVINKVLSRPKTKADESDRRQLAHAWKDGAMFFATRDQYILDHAEKLRSATGLVVLRPADLVARIHDYESNYSPIRLTGAQITRRKVTSENQLLAFQNFRARETKSTWLQTIREARTNRCYVEVIGLDGESPRVALGYESSSDSEIRIRFVRTLGGSLTGTLLRHVIADFLALARYENVRVMSVERPDQEEVLQGLLDLGFEEDRAGRLVRYTLPGVVRIAEAVDWIRAELPQAQVSPSETPTDIESRFWPLRILGAEIPTYIIPIRRPWAAALFDRALAGEELFGVPQTPALQLENVYFSASGVTIPAGSRILWYVSRDVGEVRAVSTCLETDVNTAHQLARRYQRLGIYEWQDILGLAKGDHHRQLLAFRFARTELLTHPVPYSRLKKLIWEHTKTNNPLASPVRVPEALFEAIYSEGFGALHE